MRKIVGLLFVSSLCLLLGCSGTSSTAPASTPSKPPDADNTARNADNSTVAETTTAQSENASDLQISAAIRKSVVDDKSLSSNAHNVKIITSGGVVTLRGPVKSDDERKTIESKAKQVAGVTQVNNLLEVEKNP